MECIEQSPIKPLIQFADLESIDVRVGTITSVEDITGSDNLVVLTVDIGDRKRRVVVGMKQERADPREIIGKQSLFVVNLEPRRLMGVLSEAMMFDIGHADGITPALAVPERPVPNGTRLG